MASQQSSTIESKHLVIAIDDDEMNLEILSKNLIDHNFAVKTFEDGESGLAYLNENPEKVDVVLLDKMMPGIDGIGVLKQMKSHQVLKEIPVILQTGDIGVEETRQGLAAGAYYYLEKPFEPIVMVSLVNAAIRDHVSRNEMVQHIRQDKSINSMMVEGSFQYHTLDEGKKLSAALAWHADSPEEISVALSELMVNAVEHGNLGISYENKLNLLNRGAWEAEINKRLRMEEYRQNFVHVSFKKSREKVHIMIKDRGKGFDWQKYMEFDPLRLTDPNGRGIAAARLMGLEIEYLGSGNIVQCSFDRRRYNKTPNSTSTG